MIKYTSEKFNSTIKFFIYTSLLLSFILISFYLIYGYEGLLEIVLGYVMSGVVLTSSLLFLNWTYKKTLKTILIVLVAGFIIRFCMIAVMIVVAVHLTTLDLPIFMLSLILFFIINQIFKVKYLYKNVRFEEK